MKKYLASFYIETEVGPKILSKVVRCIEDANARDILNALFDECKDIPLIHDIILINFWYYE